MKKHNERGAGRKKDYTVPTRRITIPIVIEEQVKELSKPYLTPKKNGN